MKKLLAIAAILAAFTSLKAETTFTGAAGFDSAYVFRGVKLADNSLTLSLDAEFDGGAYAGMWTNQPITGNIDNEFDFYGGMQFDIAEGIGLDVGGTLYYYPESGGGSETFEVFAGFGFDTELSPSIYFYYDLDLEAFTVEGSVGHSIEVDSQNSFDLAAFIGNVDGKGFSYTYYGASADLVHNLNDSSAASVGIRVTDGSSNLSDEIFFGASVTTGF